MRRRTNYFQKTKVANTEQSTYKIERIARQFDGFVTKTDLESRIIGENSTPISSDSVLQIMQYEVSNTLSLRVPTQRLDTFLSEISSIYKFLDYRRVHAEDCTVILVIYLLKCVFSKVIFNILYL